ncbi:MAG: zinc ribbon domain-containing protein [candidate division WOR-3 bacterium]
MKKLINLCPKCGFFCVGSKNGFCPNCGETLINKCPQCSASIIYPLARYCAICGADFRKEKKAKKEAK